MPISVTTELMTSFTLMKVITLLLSFQLLLPNMNCTTFLIIQTLFPYLTNMSIFVFKNTQVGAGCSEWSPCDVLVATQQQQQHHPGLVVFALVLMVHVFIFSTHIYELIYFGTVPVSTKREYIKWSDTTKGQVSVFWD